MIVQEEWVSIRTTPEVVERHLTQPALMVRWRSPLIQLDPVEGELMTLGSTHCLRILPLGMASSTYKVIERDDQHVLMSITGVWEGQELWRWFVDGTRVVVQNRVEYEVANQGLRFVVLGLGRFIAGLDMRVQLFRLREMIEGPPGFRYAETRGPQKISVED
ncbi:MAG: SRPBCC family protein [Candidatus Viridilinea halotolerans]|uniref:SRPBCC family protein n=1 Tax=Candidatus Viridilinea halotolerans TaxID=2491704 RepID=A0A426U1W1_9CHLR|nr:MAG: SRPBCC family protein [Candidatus Viridilinea halotolerans]